MENKEFNELALREEIRKTWGEHGCHMSVYNQLLKRHNPLFDFGEMWDYELNSAGLVKVLLICIFPGIFYRIIWRKHQRFIQFRYPDEEA